MIKDLLAYIKILFSKWYLYISFVPGLLSVIETYSGKEIPLYPIIKDYTSIGAFLLLLIAWFSAWREHKNKTDFEVIYEVQEINSDLDENIMKAKDEINLLDQEIERKDNEGLYNSINRYVKILAEIPRDKKVELEKYIAELKSLKEQCNQWKRIIFFIKNTGSAYDTNINIRVEMQKWVILEDEEMIYNLSNPSDYPEYNSNSIYIPALASRDHSPPYRICHDKFQYELRYLHINQSAEIFPCWDWIIVERWDMEFDFEISSKNANQIIKKNIKLNVK